MLLQQHHFASNTPGLQQHHFASNTQGSPVAHQDAFLPQRIFNVGHLSIRARGCGASRGFDGALSERLWWQRPTPPPCAHTGLTSPLFLRPPSSSPHSPSLYPPCPTTNPVDKPCPSRARLGLSLPDEPCPSRALQSHCSPRGRTNPSGLNQCNDQE